MQFSFLNCVLLIIFILLIRETQKVDSFVGAPSKYLLNEVSDFEDIVEKDEYRAPISKFVKASEEKDSSISNLVIEQNSDQFRIEKNAPQDNHDTIPSSGRVFSYAAPQKGGEMVQKQNEIAYKRIVRDKGKNRGFHNENLVGKPVLFETKLDNNDSDNVKEKFLERDQEICKNKLAERNSGNVKENELENEPNEFRQYDDHSGENAPGFAKNSGANIDLKEIESNENCEDLHDLLPIPLLESVLINRLLDTEMMKSSPHRYKLVVKNILPHYRNLYKLDDPQNIECLSKHLEKRKIESESLIRKRKKKNYKRKIKNRGRRDADAKQTQFNNMIQFIGQNQTFNETFTFIPIFFGTAHPTENQFIVAGVEDTASDDEKRLVGKLLNYHPGLDLSWNKSLCPTKQLQSFLEGSKTPNTSVPSSSSIDISSATIGGVRNKLDAEDKNRVGHLKQEVKSLAQELKSKIPEISKNLMEVIQRQQPYHQRRFKKDIPPPPPLSNGQEEHPVNQSALPNAQGFQTNQPSDTNLTESNNQTIPSALHPIGQTVNQTQSNEQPLGQSGVTNTSTVPEHNDQPTAVNQTQGNEQLAPLGQSAITNNSLVQSNEQPIGQNIVTNNSTIPEEKNLTSPNLGQNNGSLTNNSQGIFAVPPGANSAGAPLNDSSLNQTHLEMKDITVNIYETVNVTGTTPSTANISLTLSNEKPNDTKQEIVESPMVNLSPGILIYPKNKQVKRSYPKGPKRRKKFAFDEFGQNTENLIDDLNIKKLLGESNLIDKQLNDVEKKSDCDVNKSKCAAETDKMLDIIQHFRHDSLSQKLGGQVDYTHRTTKAAENVTTTTKATELETSNTKAQRSVKNSKSMELKAKLNKLKSDLKLVHEIQGILNKMSSVRRYDKRSVGFKPKPEQIKKQAILPEEEVRSKYEEEVKGLGKIRLLLLRQQNKKNQKLIDVNGGNSRFLEKSYQNSK